MMVSTKAQLLWLETTRQLGKNRGILKHSWALIETKTSNVSPSVQYQLLIQKEKCSCQLVLPNPMLNSKRPIGAILQVSTVCNHPRTTLVGNRERPLNTTTQQYLNFVTEDNSQTRENATQCEGMNDLLKNTATTLLEFKPGSILNIAKLSPSPDERLLQYDGQRNCNII